MPGTTRLPIFVALLAAGCLGAEDMTESEGAGIAAPVEEMETLAPPGAPGTGSCTPGVHVIVDRNGIGSCVGWDEQGSLPRFDCVEPAFHNNYTYQRYTGQLDENGRPIYETACGCSCQPQYCSWQVGDEPSVNQCARGYEPGPGPQGGPSCVCTRTATGT